MNEYRAAQPLTLSLPLDEKEKREGSPAQLCSPVGADLVFGRGRARCPPRFRAYAGADQARAGVAQQDHDARRARGLGAGWIAVWPLPGSGFCLKYRGQPNGSWVGSIVVASKEGAAQVPGIIDPAPVPVTTVPHSLPLRLHLYIAPPVFLGKEHGIGGAVPEGLTYARYPV